MNPKLTDPFPAYDAEIRRLRRHLHGLDPAGWRRKSHCAGWSVQDVVAHLCTDELYNEACLDGTLNDLEFPGSLNAWNELGVRQRRHLTAAEVLAEWERRQRRVRRAWGRIGVRGKIPTSIGPYPLRLQVWHLAQEYAIHSDDIEVPVPARSRAARAAWRVDFGLFAATEEGEPVAARVRNGRVELTKGRQRHQLDPESFIAFLTDRPQHLRDPEQRRLVARLVRSPSR
jgi:uncharacterized protein (TIGR03083 family)